MYLMVPVYCDWKSDGRLSVMSCQTGYTVMEDRVYCGGRLDVLWGKTECTVMEDECNVIEALMEHRVHWMIIIKVLIQHKILSSRIILRARAHRQTQTHTHTGALTHTRVDTMLDRVYCGGMGVFRWRGCRNTECTLCWIVYCGMGVLWSVGGNTGCTLCWIECTVGWVYCDGGSDGTLGVHYAGLSVLWIAFIVVEGGMEHRTCAVVPSVCCSGSIGVLSWMIWWDVGYIVVD